MTWIPTKVLVVATPMLLPLNYPTIFTIDQRSIFYVHVVEIFFYNNHSLIGDKADHLYIILNGRIRTIYETPHGKKSVSGEYGKGELVGIGEVITKAKR